MTIEKHRNRVIGSLAALLFFTGLGDPTGLVNLPVLFILKDRLHASPETVAIFEAITMIPVYGAILFGLLRDRWSPFGLRDRGYIAIAAPAATALYLWLALAPSSYRLLLVGVTAAMAAYQMLDTAIAALVATVGRREAMTDSVSALWEMMETAVRVVAMLLGGWLAGHLSPQPVFLIAAGLTIVVWLWGSLAPRSLFAEDTRYEQEDLTALVRRLVSQGRLLWPVVLILLFHSFSPGWGTPLLYYLTNERHLSSEVFGTCRAAQFAGVFLAAAGFRAINQRFTVRQFLGFAIAVNILPAFLFLLIRSAESAILISMFVGFVSGLSTVAVFDLLMRCCPRGLEGAGMAVGHSAFGIASAIGDVIGAVVYSHGGFAACLIIDAAATAAIVPFLRRVPSAILADAATER